MNENIHRHIEFVVFQNLVLDCVKCETLTQPASLTVRPGQTLTITCQVSYSLSSYGTSWIRQPAGKGLEWIGWKRTDAEFYKDSLRNKFSISLASSSKTVTLTGQNVQPEDTAVYYCLYKNPSVPEHLEHEATRGGSLTPQINLTPCGSLVASKMNSCTIQEKSFSQWARFESSQGVLLLSTIYIHLEDRVCGLKMQLCVCVSKRLCPLETQSY
uniref:Ig-like domain-containing protein n=1 Tax=Myripristis murdjan TaxID=586833 RepID=A0A667X5I5_9TELE